MMGRTSNAKQRLVDTARELIHDQGYAAVGVSEICAKADVNKGSFYYFFDSKEALCLDVLDAHWARTREQWESELQSKRPALERIEKLIAGLYRTHHGAKKSFGHAIGCLLGNMALERSTHHPEVQTRLQEIFGEQIALLADVLAEAAEAGQLADGVTPKSGARDVIGFMQGMVMLAKLRNDPSVLRGMSTPVLRMLTD